MKDFYTKREVCKILNISIATLNRYIKDGRITYLKTGSARSCKVLIPKKDIQVLLKTITKPAYNITEVAKETGKSRVTIYALKKKLGRFPTKEEIKVLTK